MTPGGRFASALLGAFVVGTAVSPAARAQDAAEPPAPLLGYCAPPVVPGCLGELKSHPEAVKGCVPRAEAYEATVFAYRLCLTRETERAVREANGAMAKLRCAQHRASC